MNSKLTVSASPHITKPKSSTRRIMLDVLIALLPCVLAATYFFGIQVLVNVVVCVGACFGFELLYTLILKKEFSKKAVRSSSCLDLSCLVTGVILALNLPSRTIVRAWDFNIYQKGFSVASSAAADHILFSFDALILCLIGSLVAVVLVKMLFGGIGKNFANPACTARIFLLLCFGLSVVNASGYGIAGTTGATWLSGANSEGIKLTSDKSIFLNMFLGNRGAAAVGETSILAILIGYIYLSVRKIIDFRIPLIIMVSTAVFAVLFDSLLKTYLNTGMVLGGARMLNNIFAHLMSGGLAFGAVFMATDYATSPNTFRGQVVFAVGIAFFTMVLRVFTAMPEGVSYAILLMNLVVPLLDKHIVPKPFGATKAPRAVKHKPNMSVKEGNNA